MRILIAGIGNELMGDDGLGPIIIRMLAKVDLPGNIDRIDFGYRLYDLLLKIRDYDALIIIDAIGLDGKPGELFIIRPDSVKEFIDRVLRIDPHGATLRDILRLAYRLGYLPSHTYIIGCIPKNISLGVGLSREVEECTGKIIRYIKKIVDELSNPPPIPHVNQDT